MFKPIVNLMVNDPVVFFSGLAAITLALVVAAVVYENKTGQVS